VSQLIPKDSRQRLAVRRWEALADGVCRRRCRHFCRERTSGIAASPEWIIRQEQKVFRSLEAMAEELGEKNWCSRRVFSTLRISHGMRIGYLDLRFPEIEWRKAHPVLARLADKLSQRPSFKETLPPGVLSAEC